MTDLHARLLTEIERREEACRGSLLPAKPPRLIPLDDVIEDYHATEKLAYLAALRGVVGLHGHLPGAWTSPNDGRYRDGCITCTPGVAWPCATLRCVAEALGVEA